MIEARAANDDIAAAIARVNEADAEARIAGAPLLPSLAADAAGTRQRQKSSSTGSASTTNLFNAGLGASYQVDLWGRYRANRDAARMAAAATRHDRATVELTVMASVASTYFQFLALHDRLKVAESNVVRARNILEGLQLQHDVGTITGLEVAQQEATVATLEAAVPPLREQQEDTLDALAVLTGTPPQAIRVAAGTLADLAEPRVSPGLPSELLARRPDVARAEAQLAAADYNIAAARAAFFPSIAITANGGYASNALETLFTPAARIFSLAGGITQPLFEGGTLVAQYDLAKARHAELFANYHMAVLAAFGNVEDALTAFRNTAEQERRQQHARETAQRAYDLSLAQLHAGTVNILTVLNTESVLFAAEDALVQARFLHLQSLVSLFSALGGGWYQA
jgi:NodT family efflux transporter outer membrane factor (OMF) lipoprotein